MSLHMMDATETRGEVAVDRPCEGRAVDLITTATVVFCDQISGQRTISSSIMSKRWWSKIGRAHV